MSWYTEEEIEKLLEDEELRKRIARFVTMSGEEFFDEVYTHLSPEELQRYCFLPACIFHRNRSLDYFKDLIQFFFYLFYFFTTHCIHLSL